jgi:hypothetical protein
VGRRAGPGENEESSELNTRAGEGEEGNEEGGVLVVYFAI